MAVQEAVVQRAVQQVNGHLDLRAGPDLAALDRLPEDLSSRLAAGFHEMCEVPLGEFRIGVGLGDEGRDDPSVRAVTDLAHPGLQQGQEVAAQRPGPADGRLTRSPLVIERVERERLFRGPPAVDGRLADARPLGDRVHTHGAGAAREEEVGGCAENRSARLLASWPPTSRRLRDRLAFHLPSFVRSETARSVSGEAGPAGGGVGGSWANVWNSAAMSRCS